MQLFTITIVSCILNISFIYSLWDSTEVTYVSMLFQNEVATLAKEKQSIIEENIRLEQEMVRQKSLLPLLYVCYQEFVLSIAR